MGDEYHERNVQDRLSNDGVTVMYKLMPKKNAKTYTCEETKVEEVCGRVCDNN